MLVRVLFWLVIAVSAIVPPAGDSPVPVQSAEQGLDRHRHARLANGSVVRGAPSLREEIVHPQWATKAKESAYSLPL